ncbi:M28 family metallopeptidase [Tahibacter soli]|uniref:M28 family peptidase n=1 Tax=Tahibacter soli TaxID=2983605 RepID=A0A9X3YQJ7_9GAMM|nr:M28 family peptidase [Tahibacter soli]MDC8015670.1 M28 family peptidase [Tahibacter soli]
MLAALALMLSIPAAAKGDHAAVVDISTADIAQVEALKHGAGVRWWLELGDRLLIAGDREPMLRLARKRDVLGEIADVAPSQFALRARGCKEHAVEAGKLIARGGRWELRRLGANEKMPSFAGDAENEWRAIEPNTVVAQQFRLSGIAPAPRVASVQAVVDAIDAQRWFGDVTTLAGWSRSSYGTTSLTQARDWIGNRFSSLGLTVTKPAFSMPGSGGGTISRTNVVGTWTGTTLPNEWIVVGGHYDSRNTNLSSTTNAPGAEDNATGCAGVIELARVLVANRPQRSVLFMCYAGEEQNLYGSAAHVSQLRQSGNLAKVKSVVIMDMIGYSADNRLNADVETYSRYNTYLQKFGAAAATYVPALNVTLSTNPFGSDHMPYLQANKQAVLAIESDYDIYPHYHKSTDLPANIGPNAHAMGSAILKMNAAVIAGEAGLN